MEHRQTNHKTKDQEAVKKPWFFYVYQPGGIKLIGVLRPDCGCSRHSYNIESRGLESFAVSWDESGKSNSNKLITSIQLYQHRIVPVEWG